MRFWITFFLAGLISACGGGGTDSPPGSGTTPPGNNAPTISGTPANTVNQGQAYLFAPTADDADGDTLTFSMVGNPMWLDIDTTTGRLTGTPDATHVGTTTGITVSVSDGTDTASLPPFNLEVIAPTPGNNAPTISGTPDTTITQGQPYTFSPTADDVDGDTLTFSMVGNPVWLDIDTVTGSVTGTPGATHIGTTTSITITVSDGTDSASLPPFDLEVTALPPVNNAPTISGTPLTTIAQGQAYTFMPTADDVDGDTLTFSMVGNPTWLDIDSVTGSVTGTPGATHIGTTTGITISVTDGTDSTSLPPFDLEVTAVSNNTATVRWTIPSTNADGSTLTDLAGFRIYYGTTSGSYPFALLVDNPAATSATIDNLSPGTWYFAVKAVDKFNNESSLSTEVTKVVTP